MSWKMQVYGYEGWADVRSAGRSSYVYRYETKEAAESALNASYPEQCRHIRLGDKPGVVRVAEDSEPANMGVS